MSLGRNTIAGKKLEGFIAEIEVVREQKKELAQEEKAIFARAETEGLQPKIIRKVLSIRATKPHDRQEEQSLIDNYLHALGMADTPPLFRAVGMLNTDLVSRDSVLDALKLLVPQDGEIILKMQGQPWRLWRDPDGEAKAEPWTEPEPAAAEGERTTHLPSRARPDIPVPDATPAQAEELGAQAFRDNSPITANPFPFDDKRRPRWDKGWRNASGSDGMGPPDRAARGDGVRGRTKPARGTHRLPGASFDVEDETAQSDIEDAAKGNGADESEGGEE